MGSVYEARWNNAWQVANLINEYYYEGYLILNEDGEKLLYPIEFEEEDGYGHIYLKVSENCRCELFNADPDFDDGAHTSIKEWNKQFEKWTIVRPMYIKHLFTKGELK